MPSSYGRYAGAANMASAIVSYEDVAGYRIISQRGLYFGCQAIEAVSHVGDIYPQPNFYVGRQ